MENVASRFGQRLAHTEKKYRDQALKKLTAYLSKRTEWSDIEWDKLWKALFYCMWMSDKRPVQDELSTNLAALVHKIPSVDDALGFVHSFLRTMHREWHGIDGLRLDKFYSLMRKFVHQTLVLLANHEWDKAHVERFVSMLSSEIMSQLPNGLRLHTTDLFLTELHGAAGDSVDTETFLLLLEPFFTLLSSEYDKTVFKRVRELVFLPMLSTYKFGPQPKPKAKAKKDAKEENETDGEDDEEEEEEPKVFTEVELPFVQHRIFSIASADDTAERNRSVLYELYSHFYKATKIDSLKASQDGTLAPKKKVLKKRKQPEAEAETETTTTDDASSKKKKNKRRKKSKQGDDDNDTEMTEEPDKEKTPVPEVTTPEKKSKKKSKQDDATTKTPLNTPVKSAADETPTKKQKKAKAEDVLMEAAKALEVATPESAKKDKKHKKKKAEAEPVAETAVEVETPTKKSKKEKKIKVEADADVEMEEVETPSKKSKKDKKVKAEAVKEEEETPKKSKKEKKHEEAMKKQVEDEVAAKLEEVVLSKKDKKDKKVKSEVKKEAAPVKKDKKSDDAAKLAIVVRSGMKFRRCGGCGGIGKGLVPVGKDCCRHCERTGQLKKKAAAADKKKRKADVLATAAAEEAEAAAASKKVTFGKNRALAHELSVKRLKASKAVVKELTSDIKGVLKPGSSPVTATTKKSKKTSGRMKAADFF